MATDAGRKARGGAAPSTLVADIVDPQVARGPIMRIQAAHRISARGGDRKLATFLIDLSAHDMQRRLGDAL
ncbi:MAG TPA: hypothetical protein VFA16_10580, partial [Mycobacterium sp.]|nr:hypothetical protein [Mycobacterium sp.]